MLGALLAALEIQAPLMSVEGEGDAVPGIHTAELGSAIPFFKAAVQIPGLCSISNIPDFKRLLQSFQLVHYAF